jgi:hypothetical protein
MSSAMNCLLHFLSIWILQHFQTINRDCFLTWILITRHEHTILFLLQHLHSLTTYVTHTAKSKSLLDKINIYCRQLFIEIRNLSNYCGFNSIPWSRMPKKLTVAQPVKKLPDFYGTWRFVAVFTTARKWTSSWNRVIHSVPSHPICSRSIMKLSSDLRLLNNYSAYGIRRHLR